MSETKKELDEAELLARFESFQKNTEKELTCGR